MFCVVGWQITCMLYIHFVLKCEVSYIYSLLWWKINPSLNKDKLQEEVQTGLRFSYYYYNLFGFFFFKLWMYMAINTRRNIIIRVNTIFFFFMFSSLKISNAHKVLLRIFLFLYSLTVIITSCSHLRFAHRNQKYLVFTAMTIGFCL